MNEKTVICDILNEVFYLKLKNSNKWDSYEKRKNGVAFTCVSGDGHQYDRCWSSHLFTNPKCLKNQQIIFFLLLLKQLNVQKEGSHGLVVKADSSQPRGCEFKPRHGILDGYKWC